MEVWQYLANGFDRKSFDAIVNDRKDWFVIESNEGADAVFLSGDEARNVAENVRIRSTLRQSADSKIVLQGHTASVGSCVGRAVVVPYIRSIEDEAYKQALKEFNKGDILVTKNSVPEIIEIIKKAGAIVTEEGGITCHGAIMAREFKVPGIVGVDGVTEVIKTGDTVEISAYTAKGKVTIISH